MRPLFALLLLGSINALSADILRGHWIQSGCELRRWEEAISTKGDRCLFLSDGTVISADQTSVRRKTKNGRVLWESREGLLAESLTLDRIKILTVSTVQALEKIRLRDLNGKIIYERSSDDILPGARFTSIYEVKPNAKSEKLAYFAAGNIILNAQRGGTIILSPDLSKTLYRLKLGDHLLEDVQVSSNGELLIFNNLCSRQGPKYSAVQLYDTEKEKVVLDYSPMPLGIFYTPSLGGVQEIEDLIHISHPTTGSYFYSLKERRIIGSVPKLGPELENSILSLPRKLVKRP